MKTTNNAGSAWAGPALLLVAVVLPLIPLYAWGQEALMVYQASDHLPTLLLYYPGRAAALLGFVLMFYQFVLGVRLPFMERFFKRYVTIKRHRTLGKIGFLLVLLHGVFMLVYETAMAGTLFLDLARVIGLAALVLLSAAVVAAWFSKPLKLSRKTWLRIHFLGYLVFPLAFIHALMLSPTMAGSEAVAFLFFTLFGAYVLIVAYRVSLLFTSSAK